MASLLDKCYFYNNDKLQRAKQAVALKGNLNSKDRRSENTLYQKAIQELTNPTDEDIVLFIYKGLAGKVDEFTTVVAAEEQKVKEEKKVKIKKKKE